MDILLIEGLLIEALLIETLLMVALLVGALPAGDSLIEDPITSFALRLRCEPRFTKVVPPLEEPRALLRDIITARCGAKDLTPARCFFGGLDCE